MGYFWDIFGISLGYIWDIFGKSLGYLWDIIEISLGYLWDIFGISLGYLLSERTLGVPPVIFLTTVDLLGFIKERIYSICIIDGNAYTDDDRHIENASYGDLYIMTECI